MPLSVLSDNVFVQRYICAGEETTVFILLKQWLYTLQFCFESRLLQIWMKWYVSEQSESDPGAEIVQVIV